MYSKIVISFVLVTLANVSFAQKIVVLDPALAMLNTKYALAKFKELDAKPEYIGIRNEVEKLKAELQALGKDKEVNGLTWSNEKKAEIKKKEAYLLEDYKLAINKFKAERGAVEQMIGVELQDKLREEVTKIIESEGISIILRPDVIQHASADSDITRKVVDALDSRK